MSATLDQRIPVPLVTTTPTKIQLVKPYAKSVAVTKLPTPWLLLPVPSVVCTVLSNKDFHTSKTGVSVAPLKVLMFSKNFLKKSILELSQVFSDDHLHT